MNAEQTNLLRKIDCLRGNQLDLLNLAAEIPPLAAQGTEEAQMLWLAIKTKGEEIRVREAQQSILNKSERMMSKLESAIEVRVSDLEKAMTQLADEFKAYMTADRDFKNRAAVRDSQVTEFMRRYTQEDKPKYDEIYENQNKAKGGWIVISVLGGIVVGGSAVGGLVYAVLNHGK